MVSKSQKKVRAAILFIGTFTFLCYLIVPGWRMVVKHDHDNAAPQRAIATVEICTQAASSPFSGAPEPARVMVRFQGKVQDAREIHHIERLAAGREAQIIYRIGRTGRMYIDSVEPLETAGK